MNTAEYGVLLRFAVLALVSAMAWIATLVFAYPDDKLADPTSLYTLLVVAIVVLAMCVLLEQTLLLNEDIKEALSTTVYPQRLRIPMRVNFREYVEVWLAWWFISQLFFCAGVVYESGVIRHLLLVPLVLFAFSIDCLFDASARTRYFSIVALWIITTIVAFFPTRDWAPQHASVVWTELRVVLFFVSIMVRDYISPANVYANINTDVNAERVRSLHQQLFGADSDLESGDKRVSRVVSIVDAYDRIDNEMLRVREFIWLSAWILVSPMYIVLLLFPLAMFAAVYAGRRDTRLINNEASETRKQHPVPAQPAASVVVPLVASTRSTTTTTASERELSMGLPQSITLRRTVAPPAAALPPIVQQLAAQPPPSSSTAPTQPVNKTSSGVVVKHEVF